GAAWAGYSRSRLGWPSSGGHELTAVRLHGYGQVLRDYWPDRSDASDVDAVIAITVAAVWVVVRWWKRRTLPLTTALPFAILVPFLAGPVLYLSLNSLRAFGPAITFVALDVYAAVEVTK